MNTDIYWVPLRSNSTYTVTIFQGCEGKTKVEFWENEWINLEIAVDGARSKFYKILQAMAGGQLCIFTVCNWSNFAVSSGGKEYWCFDYRDYMMEYREFAL